VTPSSHEWLRRFRAYLTLERRLSAHTDTNYALDLAALVSFCDKQQLESWQDIDSQHVRTFAAHSHAGGLAPRSIQRRLSAVRSFFSYLIHERLNAENVLRRAQLTDDMKAIEKAQKELGACPNIRVNPGLDVRAPKVGRTLPGTLDVDRMARLLELPPGDALVARDRAIMELLYSSGLRLAELVALNLSHLLADRTVLVAAGKGQKSRIVPVGSKAAAALEVWIRERGTIARVGELALFVGRNGRRIGPRAVQKRVAYWARRQGIDMHVHPHLFRHSFASHLLESSQELRGVQELLGHADISSTQIYTHLDFQHLARIYEAAHPRARKKA
jgi:integrase/recombinase XerC